MIYKSYCKYVKDLDEVLAKFTNTGERIISVTPFGTSGNAVTIITERSETKDE
jgi:hypothetical protein